MLRDEFDKFGIRMSEIGEVKEEWLVHESVEDTGFSCFDNEKNLVYIVKTKDSKEAIGLTNTIRIAIIKKGLWGDDKACRKFFR